MIARQSLSRRVDLVELEDQRAGERVEFFEETGQDFIAGREQAGQFTRRGPQLGIGPAQPQFRGGAAAIDALGPP